MDWHDIGWKCKILKKISDILMLVCTALIILIIVLHVKAPSTRYDTMADLAAEAATHMHWQDMNEYEIRQMDVRINALDEEYAALQAEMESLLNNQ